MSRMEFTTELVHMETPNVDHLITHIIAAKLQFMVVDELTYETLSNLFQHLDELDEFCNLERNDNVHMTSVGNVLFVNDCVVAHSPDLTFGERIEYPLAEIVADFISSSIRNTVIRTLTGAAIQYHVISGEDSMRLAQASLSETEVIRYLAHCANRWK